eukprot:TRINITY_DN6058_c0_g1_i2.p1 TRINITY_DN6058_c0_g1~~TRINITY_DN6058_c0_g1_i2.p1  ORF type:complete len:366 (+),score=82.61 TRINITY_DN6058_c0_g1_i2:80-1177(+)
MSRYKQINDIDVGDDFVLPEGNVVRGQLLFKKHCAQCHTIRRDGTNPYGTLAGPNLYGVMGRTAAMNQRTGWVKYSTSLEGSGILWTERNMMAFLKNPRAFAGGAINMNFRGIESWQDRVDLIHYLQRAGHESWMVQDGTPHSQKQWWTRGVSGPTKNYWEVNSNNKHTKPWQHAYRGASKKASEAKRSMLESIGLGSWVEEDSSSSSKADSASMEEDNRETQTWLRVKEVEDGVQSASMQRSFNWPPLEVIQDGPKRRAPAAVAPAPPPPPAETIFAPSMVAACQEKERPAGRGLGAGSRAPSGLMVFPDKGGPASFAPPAPRAPPAAPAAQQSSGGNVKNLAEGRKLADGGLVTPGGLVLYKT